LNKKDAAVINLTATSFFLCYSIGVVINPLFIEELFTHGQITHI